MKFIIVLLLWTLIPSLICQQSENQDANFSISPQVDQLLTAVAANPGDAHLRIKLSNAYLEAFNPELALIELIDLEKITSENPTASRIKGIALIQLEQFPAALSALQDAYFMAGDDTSLKYLAIADFSLGNRTRGSRVISVLLQKYPDLPDQLYAEYKHYYVNNRLQSATAVYEILTMFAPEKLSAYFPNPQISIISPENQLATESENVAVIFEVSHIHPIKDVQLKGLSLYHLDPSTASLQDNAFKKTFTHKISLIDGYNSIPITVTDIYNKSELDTVIVNTLYFKRPFAWTSGFSDSLYRQTALLKSYVPTDLIQNNEKPYRLLVCGAQTNDDSLKFNHRALFFYDLLTNDMWGKTNIDQAKLVLANRFKSVNVYPLLDNWLYKQSNVQTKNLIYFAGKWELSAEHWNLKTVDNQQVDVKKIIKTMSGLAAARSIFFIDGWSENDTTYQSELKTIIEGAPVPMAAVLLNEMSWEFNYDSSAIFKAMPDGVQSGIPKDTVDLSNIAKYLPTQKIIASRQNLAWEVLCDPKIKIYNRFVEMYGGMLKKLDREKVQGAKRKLIEQFYADWIRIGEIRKFLLDDWTKDDFYIRAEEYYQRNEGKASE